MRFLYTDGTEVKIGMENFFIKHVTKWIYNSLMTEGW